MSGTRFVAASLGLLVLGPGVVSGQDYPNKTIRIVTSTAGGGNDFTARLIAQGISGPLGQNVIVENRAGILAAEVVSKAPPDGYSLTVQSASLWTRPLLTKIPYDAERDFAPITLIASGVNVLVLNPSVAVKTVKELIALAKTNPGAINYATSGVGSTAHLAVELFKSMAGVNLVAVPYKGTAPAIAAVISGEVQLTINDLDFVAPHVKSGKVRALAITSAQPSALLPGLPTVAASGLPGYESVSIVGILAPAKTPPAIVNQLNREIVRFLNQPEVKERFLNAGVEIVGNSPQQFAAIMKADIARMSKVIKDAGIKAD